MGAEDQSMVDRRTLSQESLGLLEYRVKQLEDERMPHRMLAAEAMMKQLQDDVREIARETKEFGDRLDMAVQQLADNQLRFLTFTRAALWLSGIVGAGIAAVVTWGPPILRMVGSLPVQ